MKKLALFVCLLVVTVAAQAQFEKGKWILNPSITGLEFSHDTGTDKTSFGREAKGGDILLSIAELRIAGKEISGCSRNVNKQGQREPGRFLDFLHYQSFLVVLKYQILNQIAASTTAIKAMPSA